MSALSEESTVTLLVRLRQGDALAREVLFGRYLPALRRWAHGRLPGPTRDLNDTNDLVQITLMSALKNLDHFESEREGSLLAYLRTSVMNAIRDEIRRTARSGTQAHSADLQVKIEQQEAENFDADQWLDYERALSTLSELKREAVVLRLEFGMSYAEIASALNRPSEAAAMMTVKRALVELAERMK